MAHTKEIWVQDGLAVKCPDKSNGTSICICTPDLGVETTTPYDNAARIVHCVNAHDALTAERDALREALQEIVLMWNSTGAMYYGNRRYVEYPNDAFAKAQNLIQRITK